AHGERCLEPRPSVSATFRPSERDAVAQERPPPLERAGSPAVLVHGLFERRERSVLVALRRAQEPEAPRRGGERPWAVAPLCTLLVLILVLAPVLPRADSGHNSYWWWSRPPDGTTTVVGVGFDRRYLQEFFRSVLPTGSL